MTDRFF